MLRPVLILDPPMRSTGIYYKILFVWFCDLIQQWDLLVYISQFCWYDFVTLNCSIIVYNIQFETFRPSILLKNEIASYAIFMHMMQHTIFLHDSYISMYDATSARATTCYRLVVFNYADFLLFGQEINI